MGKRTPLLIERSLQSRRGSTASKLALALFGVLLVGSILLGALLYQGEREGEKVDVLIPRGKSLKQVSEILAQNEVIKKPNLFKTLLRFTGGSSWVRAGEFRLRKNMRPIDALFALYRDEPLVHAVTIPEGWTIRQIAEYLAVQGLANRDRFLQLTLNRQSAIKYQLPSPTLEGFLYPDTYDISKIDSEEKIVERMVHRFKSLYDKEAATDARAQGKDLLFMVTFASIIEKETGIPDERTLISSVFHNRLKKKMRLQSDPTTIYGIPNFNGNLRRVDLQTYTPYNTYVINGLPPGPICNPGIQAIKAVLTPADTKYLYFVANKQGKHLFSETYAQHTRFVNSYQKSMRGEALAGQRH